MEEAQASSSSDDTQLHIAETPKKKRRRKTKPFEFDDTSGIELDKTIKNTINKCVNLTSDAAKKVLCKLVKNDHVLALALLKAEEEDDRNRESKHSESTEIASEEDDYDKKSENEVPVTPKLTRLKAKQLNQHLPIPGSLLDTHQPDEEVVKLIREELKSDDEDEEYQPENDSDGDITATTFSDIDSQPSTPGSALFQYDEMDSPLKSGDFKIPRTPLTAEEQETISRRTRSKLNLETTPIETIESNFVPPDIDYEDLYNFEEPGFETQEEWDWKNFLCEYNQPLPFVEDEKDDEADPEYVAAEQIPLDKEELRPVRVPKKELNELYLELFDDSFLFTGESSSSSTKSKGFEMKVSKRPKTPSKGNKYPAPKISSKVYSPAELNTPPHHNEPVNLNKTLETTPDQHHYYSPHQMLQTPLRNYAPSLTTPLQSPAQHSALSYSPYQYASPMNTSLNAFTQPPPQSSVVMSPQVQNVIPVMSPEKIIQVPTQPSASLLIINQNQLEIRPLADSSGAINTNSIMSQGFYLNGVYTLPQYQSLVLQVPTIDLLQNNIEFALPTRENDSSVANVVESEENLTDDKKTLIKKGSRLKVFKNLVNQEPEKKMDDTTEGFTHAQQLIFEQQLEMHSQMLAVNYLQLYAHPFWWHLAEGNRAKLIELKEIRNSDHIENCLNLCTAWEQELEEDNESNKKYMQFLHEEIELDQKSYAEKKRIKGRFHNRFMERILQSNAIIYPSLLPHTPFRALKFAKVDPVLAELTLIALGYEIAYETLYKELNNFNPTRIREPKLKSIASEIIRQVGSFRTEAAIVKMIEKYKSHSLMNPIKYYFKHKRAPKIVHELMERQVKPPALLRKGYLPKLWENYKFSYERQQIHPFIVDDEESPLSNSSVISDDLKHTEEVESIAINHESLQIKILIPKIEPDTIEEAAQQEIVIEEEIETRNLTSILKKDSKKSPTKRKSVNFLLPIETPKKVPRRFTLSDKFQAIIEEFFEKYTESLYSDLEDSNYLLLIVFKRFRSFDVYLKLLKASKMLAKKSKIEGANGNSSSSESIKPKKQITSEEYSKRINRKLADNRALIMQNLRNENSAEKDCSYSYNYLEKVKKTLIEAGDEALYGELMKTLTTFNPDIESVPELYFKMEALLLPNYSDLLDLFLTFLLPEHAAEIGKFCEHFLLTRMSELIQNLNSYFHKQPSHMKKIYSCLNELSNETDLTLEKLKAKILPLLKGNQLLIEWFLGIFEPATDSLDEFETLHLKKPLSEGEVCDYSYEEMTTHDLEGDSSSFSSCGVKYINGKIMYRCKTLLPAKISFLVNDSNEEKLISTSKDEKPSNSSLCVHEIRKHVLFSDKVSENAIKKKKPMKKFKVCDAVTLHAHAVRLNPIHAQSGEKVSDVMNLLEANSTAVSSTLESPKKNVCKSAKKSSGSSPKKSLTKSPSSSSETSSINLSPSPSKHVTKKTRTESEDEQLQMKSVKKLKLRESSGEDESEISLTNSDENTSATTTSSNKTTEDTEAWTRDEDKLILEEIKSGKGEKEEIIKSLSEKIEKRNRKEILERYEFLLNFLTHLTGATSV